MRLFIVYGHNFGEKVIGNMVNLPDFCTACDLACAHCRVKYSCFAPDVCGAFRTSADLPELIDDPEPYLPKIMPKIDILLAIGLHPDLLAGLPSIAKKADAGAVIVPVEETRWCPQSLRDELRHSFDEQKMEYAFPKPFCELGYSNGLIGDFVRRYKIGKPLLEVSI